MRPWEASARRLPLKNGGGLAGCWGVNRRENMPYKSEEQKAAARLRLRKRERKWNTEYPYFHFRNCIYRLRAKAACDLKATDLRALWFAQEGRCAMSGLKMTWGAPLRATTVSIDRLKAGRGYVKRNVRLVCYGLNALRGSGTDAEALMMARAFIKHLGEQPS